MKKHFITLAALAIATLAQATVVLNETFEYDVDSLCESENWTSSGTIETGTGRTIDATPLVYVNNGGEYFLSDLGKSVKQNYAQGKDYIAYRTFDKVSSGAVYLSYLYKPDGKQNQSNGELLGITSISENSTGPTARPWVGKLASGNTTGDPYRLGLTFRSGTSSDIQWSSKELGIDEVVLIVLKYDLDNNIASLFINPEIGSTTEPVADVTDNKNTTETYRSSLNAIMFRNTGGSKSNFYVSGVRISTTWEEAVAAKEADDTPIETIDFIDTDFNDGTWGEIATSSYTSGKYPSSEINGFELTAAGMQNGSKKYGISEGDSITFRNRISVDKNTEGGMITFPTVATCKEVIVYASAGSADKNMKLQKYNFTTKTWSDIATWNFATTNCYKFTEELNLEEPTRLRIVNNDGGTKYIWKIQTTAVEGDGGSNTPTLLDNTTTEVKAQKVMIDGNLYILRNGEVYTLTGAKL